MEQQFSNVKAFIGAKQMERLPKPSSVRGGGCARVRACVRVCVWVCVYVSVFFKLLFVLCKFSDLGDPGCEFDARQLWLETFFGLQGSIMFW